MLPPLSTAHRGLYIVNGPSSVYLLRHAETNFNVIHDSTGEDPLIFDAPLSDHGQRQLANLADAVALVAPELIVSSPLTRALQTAVALVGEGGPPIMVHELLRERQTNSCDVGRVPALLSLEFPTLDFRHLPEVWWYEGDTDWRGIGVEPEEAFDQRIAEFKRWLAGRSEATVLLIGHGEFFARFAGVSLRNCELRAWQR